MAEPSFLGDGETGSRTDTTWVEWVKILGHYQNQAGALPENNPNRHDPLRVIKQKILNAINGTSYTG